RLLPVLRRGGVLAEEGDLPPLGPIRVRGEGEHGGAAAGALLPAELALHARSRARRRHESLRAPDAPDPRFLPGRLLFLPARAFVRLESRGGGAFGRGLRLRRLHGPALRLREQVGRLRLASADPALLPARP